MFIWPRRILDLATQWPPTFVTSMVLLKWHYMTRTLLGQRHLIFAQLRSAKLGDGAIETSNTTWHHYWSRIYTRLQSPGQLVNLCAVRSCILEYTMKPCSGQGRFLHHWVVSSPSNHSKRPLHFFTVIVLLNIYIACNFLTHRSILLESSK